MKFLIGTYTKHNSLGIYTSSILDDKLGDVSLLASSSNPSYLDYFNQLTFSTYADSLVGGLSLFRNDSLVSQNIDEGKGPSHVSYNPRLKMAFTANYNRGEIRTYLVKNNTLKLNEVIRLGEKSHAHQIFYHHDTRRVFVCDLGLDTIFVYKLSIFKKLILDYKIKLPDQSGPRHVVIASKQNRLYCIGELSNQLFVFNYKKKEMVGIYSTISDETKLGQQAAAIRIFGDDIYVSNRGFENSIAHFKITADGLSHINSYDVMGKHPRDFNISPKGDYLVVANLESNNLSLFKRGMDGSLSFLDSQAALEPTSILFI